MIHNFAPLGVLRHLAKGWKIPLKDSWSKILDDAATNTSLVGSLELGNNVIILYCPMGVCSLFTLERSSLREQPL